MKKFLWFQAPLLAACTGVFVLSSLPDLSAIPLSTLPDKLLHALAYGVLGVLAYRAFANQDRFRALKAHPVFSSILFAIVYGATDEVHQRFVPGRSASMGDLIADAIGAAIFVFLFARLTGWRSRREAPVETPPDDPSGHA